MSSAKTCNRCRAAAPHPGLHPARCAQCYIADLDRMIAAAPTGTGLYWRLQVERVRILAVSPRRASAEPQP